MRDCVMYRNGKCVGLVIEPCPKGCRFYKTKTDLALDVLKAHGRLNVLPLSKQRKIASKYYGGKMPWLYE